MGFLCLIFVFSLQLPMIGSLVLEATALPIVTQPLSILLFLFFLFVSTFLYLLNIWSCRIVIEQKPNLVKIKIYRSCPKINPVKQRTQGLVVMWGDSHSEGCGFESQCHILDGYFFSWICCKIVLMFVWKGRKYTKKMPGMARFFLKKYQLSLGRECIIELRNNSSLDKGWW